MAKDLPYFRWFTARAKADEKYTSMPDRELGFFHRCLNHAWDNDGLPADQEALARAMHCTRRYLDTVWKIVGPCWYQDGDRLRNKTQEEERAHATTKSEKATDAIRTRYRRASGESTSVGTSVGTNDLPRAYDSDSVSESQVKIPEKQKVPIPFPNGSRFLEWINGYQGRKADEDSACRAWISVGADSQAEAAFACRDRYNGSREVAEGKCMEAANFIFQQARNGWKGNWPKARDPTESVRLTATQIAIQRAKEREAAHGNRG